MKFNKNIFTLIVILLIMNEKLYEVNCINLERRKHFKRLNKKKILQKQDSPTKDKLISFGIGFLKGVAIGTLVALFTDLEHDVAKVMSDSLFSAQINKDTIQGHYQDSVIKGDDNFMTQLQSAFTFDNKEVKDISLKQLTLSDLDLGLFKEDDYLLDTSENVKYKNQIKAEYYHPSKYDETLYALFDEDIDEGQDNKNTVIITNANGSRDEDLDENTGGSSQVYQQKYNKGITNIDKVAKERQNIYFKKIKNNKASDAEKIAYTKIVLLLNQAFVLFDNLKNKVNGQTIQFLQLLQKASEFIQKQLKDIFNYMIKELKKMNVKQMAIRWAKNLAIKAAIIGAAAVVSVLVPGAAIVIAMTLAAVTLIMKAKTILEAYYQCYKQEGDYGVESCGAFGAVFGENLVLIIGKATGVIYTRHHRHLRHNQQKKLKKQDNNNYAKIKEQ